MIKKLFFTFVVIFFIWIWKDYKKIDFSYINQNKITYSYNNLNNKFLKKIHNFINAKYENFLLNYSDKQKNHWSIENKFDRQKLPEYKYIDPSRELTPNTKEYQNIGQNWTRSHGDNTSARFSNLREINNSNASKLKVAWKFEIKGHYNDIQANPIAVEGIIYTPVAGGFIVAIDGSNGKLIWKSEQFGYFAARRGLVFWQNNNTQEKRLYFSNREKLICLNAKTGKLIKDFGNNGKVRTGLNVITPAIYKNEIIIATWENAVEVYDLLSGKNKWKLKYKKEIKDRVGSKKYNNEGSNPWGGISLDEERGILYLTTGNPHQYFDGTLRPGNNFGSNSIIAVDIKEKKILWDFQETSHDIWNSDLPAPPVLTSTILNKKKIDIVLTPTKRANTLILDRLTGNPIFKYRLRKAPSSNIPGEKTSFYQPDIEIPEPFGKNVFTKYDFWSYDQNKIELIKKKYKDFKYGFYQTYDLNQKNLQYNFNGGAEWMGASVDHKKNIMYISSNNIPWETALEQINKGTKDPPEFISSFVRAQDEEGYPISNPPWGTITALNLNNGKKIWQIPFGEYEELSEKGIEITGTENFGGVTGTEGDIILATGTLDKNFYVFDTINGQKLFSYKLPYIGSSPPTTYVKDGKQFIIVHSTGGSTLMQGYPDRVESGNALYAFTLE